MSNYDDLDEYYDSYDDEGGFKKNRNTKKKKFKGKGHQSRRSEAEIWSQMMEEDYSSYDTSSYSEERKSYPPRNNYSGNSGNTSTGTNPAPHTWEKKPYDQKPYEKKWQPSEPRKFVANPATTKNIKGIDIDFSGVVSMSKEDSIAMGYNTYGVRFTFKGIKSPFKIIWYGRSSYLRDKAYDEYKAYWDSLNGVSTENK